MLLKDKVALVTGSGTGIGKGIALRFAREGAAVVVNSRTEANVKATAEEIRKLGGTALEAAADVTVEAEVERLFARLMAELGRIDILVNNAMTPNARWSAPFLQLTSAEWDGFMKANLGSLFYCTHRAAKIMARQKIRGSIINISTNGAVRPAPRDHRLRLDEGRHGQLYPRRGGRPRAVGHPRQRHPARPHPHRVEGGLLRRAADG